MRFGKLKLEGSPLKSHIINALREIKSSHSLKMTPSIEIRKVYVDTGASGVWCNLAVSGR